MSHAAQSPHPPATPVASTHPASDPPWAAWRAHFERNRRRPLPAIGGGGALSPGQVRALAWSLARFQILETGEGRIVRTVARSTVPAIDDDYRRALELFIAEEGRHARILGALVRALGGELVRSSWTERLFVLCRRLVGVRFKLLTMFAAEVVGVAFYGGLAERLPRSPARAALEQIADDERAHLAFHRQFFTLEAPHGWRRALFLVAWATLARAAALVVLLDHRRTLRAFGITMPAMAGRLSALVREGER